MVFEAVDRRSAKKVAIKLITHLRDDDGGLAVRIQREIRILTELSHPNVVAYFGSGSLPDGRLYLIFEWLSGEDLSDFMMRAPLPLRSALEISRQVADALSSAHELGVIHRDIKPANIFLLGPKPGTPDVRVLDFGIAKAEESHSGVTRAGAILGTPSYMAPEQASFAKDVDGRADIYSVGVLAFEMITGRLPWKSRSDLARLARIMVDPAAKIQDVNPDVPTAVADVIDRMLELRREDRYSTMREARDRIRDCLRTVSAPLLDTVYTTDERLLGQFMQERTAAVDFPRSLKAGGSAAVVAAPSVADVRSSIRDPAEAAPPPIPARSMRPIELQDPAESDEIQTDYKKPGEPDNAELGGRSVAPKAPGGSGARTAPDNRATLLLDGRGPLPNVKISSGGGPAAETQALVDTPTEPPPPPPPPPLPRRRSSSRRSRRGSSVGGAKAKQLPGAKAKKLHADGMIPPSRGGQLERSGSSETSPGEGPPPGASTNKQKPYEEALSYVVEHGAPPLLGRAPMIDRFRAILRVDQSPEVPRRTVVVGPAGAGKSRLRVEIGRLARQLSPAPLLLSGRAEDSARSTPFGFLRRMLLQEAKIFAGDPPDVRASKLDTLIPPATTVARLLRADAPNRSSTGHGSEEHTRFSRMEGRDAGTARERDRLADEGGERAREGHHPRATRPADRFFGMEERWTERPSIVSAMSDAFDLDQSSSSSANAEMDRIAVLAFLAEALELPVPDIGPIRVARADPRVMGTETVRAVDLVLRDMADKSGMLILIDDAHLVDHQSAFVLRELTRADRGLRVKLIAFGLPNMLESGPGALLAGDGLEVIEVPPLDTVPSREVARRLIDAPVRPDALDALVQRSAGNPLHIEQLVRAVIETELLVVDEDAYDFDAEKHGAEAIPGTIAAAVRARVSKLPHDLQRAISAAAVFGEAFWVEGVARLLGEPVEEVAIRLDKLVVRDLVRRRASSRYLGATEMEFSHAVIRSVVLSRLKKHRREMLETAAIEYLESCGESDEAILAVHYTFAGQLERAAQLYARGAARSLASGSFSAAVALAEAGLRSVEGGELKVETRADLMDLVAKSLELMDDLEAADQTLENLEALEVPEERKARFLERRSRLALKRNRPDLAREWAESAERRMTSIDVALARTEAKLAAAEAHDLLGDGRAALRAFIPANGAAESQGFRLGLVRSTRGLARIALAGGDYRNAESRFRESLVHARTVRDLGGIFRSQIGLAEVSCRLGDRERAFQFADGAERLATKSFEVALARAMRARISAEAGEVERAAEVLEETARRTPNGPEDRAVWWIALLYSAKVRLGYGLGGAWAELDAAKRLAKQLKEARDEVERGAPCLLTAVEMHLAHLLALVGEKDRAVALCSASVERFRREGALTEDEPPVLFLARARILERTGAPRAELKSALQVAIAQMDTILVRLTIPLRDRYLERPPMRVLLKASEVAGLEVARDPKSHRVSVK